MNYLARVAGLNDRNASLSGTSTLVSTHHNGLVVENAINEYTNLVLNVVVVDRANGNFFRLLVGLILVNAEISYGRRGVVADNSTLCTVNKSSHGVVSLTTGGAEYLTDNVVGELHDSDGSVVVGN